MELALFDLDHTLIPFDSGYSWLTWLKDAGRLDEADYVPQSLGFARAYHEGQLDTPSFYRFVLSFLTRFDRADLETWREAFIVDIGPRITSMRSIASSGGMWLNWLPPKELG